jgi:hypothetical protein
MGGNSSRLLQETLRSQKDSWEGKNRSPVCCSRCEEQLLSDSCFWSGQLMRGSASCEEQPLGGSREEQPLTGSCEEKPLRGSCEEQLLTATCEEQPLIDSCELQLCFGNCELQLLFGSCKRWQLPDAASWQESSLTEDSFSFFRFQGQPFCFPSFQNGHRTSTWISRLSF